MNRKEFAVVFAVMCEYYGAAPSDGISDIYFHDLKNWTLEQFKQAFAVLRETRVFNGLPKVAEIREGLDGKPQDRAAIAYETLIKTIRRVGSWGSVIFEDGAIGHAVEAMGGWKQVCVIEDWNYRRKDFESLYLANTRTGRSEPILLSGSFNLMNVSIGQEGWDKPMFVTKDMKFIEGGDVKQLKAANMKLIK